MPAVGLGLVSQARPFLFHSTDHFQYRHMYCILTNWCCGTERVWDLRLQGLSTVLVWVWLASLIPRLQTMTIVLFPYQKSNMGMSSSIIALCSMGYHHGHVPSWRKPDYVYCMLIPWASMVSIAMHGCISVLHANRKTGEKLSGNEAKLTGFSDHIVYTNKTECEQRTSK